MIAKLLVEMKEIQISQLLFNSDAQQVDVFRKVNSKLLSIIIPNE